MSQVLVLCLPYSPPIVKMQLTLLPGLGGHGVRKQRLTDAKLQLCKMKGALELRGGDAAQQEYTS